MAKLTRDQMEYIKKNYDGTNLNELSQRLNIPLKELNKIIHRFQTTTKTTGKKYCPVQLEKIYKFTPADILVFIGLFFTSLFVYTYTMTPGIAAGDCGELTCAVYFLGGAHSPGYPLYCVVGKLFMWLFFFIGRIVYRLTFLSAFCGAITISVSYLFFVKFLGRYHHENKYENLFFAKFPAIAGALFFLFSDELWSQAVIAEVYTVNSLFLPIMFLLALIYEDRITQNTNLLSVAGQNTKMFLWNRVMKIWYVFFLLFGVAVGDHHIILGYLIPFVIFFIYPYLKDKTFIRVVIAITIAYGFALISFVYYQLPVSFHNLTKIVILVVGIYIFYKIYIEKPKLILAFIISGVFLGLGLMIYVYMPVRSLANAPLDWGDPEKWQNFWNIVKRVQYRGFAQNIRSIGVTLRQTYILFQWRLEQFSPYVYMFSFLGLYRLYKINKKWFYFTLSFVLYYDVAFQQFNNFKFTPRDMFFARVFFIPSYMFNLYWIVIGLEYAIKLIEKHIIKDSLINHRKIGWGIGIILILMSYFPFKENYDNNNVRHAWANDNYGRNILKTLEYKSILFTEGGDNQVFSLLYHNYVEYLRPDVNDPNAPNDAPERGIFDQKGNVFLLYGPMMRMTPKQLAESQVTHDYEKMSTGRPIYYTWKDYRRQKKINDRYGENFEYRQVGILYRNTTKGSIFNPAIDYWHYYDFAWQEYPEEGKHWDYLSREIIANYCFQLGDTFMGKAYKEYNIYQQTKDINHYNQYKKYDKLAYEKYRLSQSYGFDMTAIHFNLALLLERKIRFLQREKTEEATKAIIEVLDEAIKDYMLAAGTENQQGNAARAYTAAARAYGNKAVFEPEKEVEYMKKAVEFYKKGIEINPKFKEAKQGLQRAESIIKNPTERLKQLEIKIQQNPRNEKLLFELFKVYIDRLEANKGVVLLEQGLRNMPKSVNIMYNLGNLYQQLKKHDKAIKIFNKVLRINPNDPRIYYYLGASYDALQQFEKAYNNYKLFLNLGRNLQDKNTKAMMGRAQQRVRQLAPQYEK